MNDQQSSQITSVTRTDEVWVGVPGNPTSDEAFQIVINDATIGS
jgi:hypothetical protein